MSDPVSREEVEITHAAIRLNEVLTGTVLGVLCGGGLFLATLWLVIKGGPNTGAHLMLLNQFFPGYTVSVAGAFIGFAYAFAVGFGAGFLIGAVYNRLAR